MFIAAAPVDRVYRHRFTGDRLRRIQPNGISTRCWCTLAQAHDKDRVMKVHSPPACIVVHLWKGQGGSQHRYHYLLALESDCSTAQDLIFLKFSGLGPLLFKNPWLKISWQVNLFRPVCESANSFVHCVNNNEFWGKLLQCGCWEIQAKCLGWKSPSCPRGWLCWFSVKQLKLHGGLFGIWLRYRSLCGYNVSI